MQPRANPVLPGPAPVATPAPRAAHHLLVLTSESGRQVGYRVIDLAQGGYPPLVKELAWQAVAARPALAGRTWELAARMDDADPAAPALRVEALVGGDPAPAAVLSVPLGHLAWLGAAAAEQCRLRGRYEVAIGVLGPDDPCVGRWLQREADPDFAAAAGPAPPLRFPGDFTREPLPPRVVVERCNAPLRCVFPNAVLQQFLLAARRETQVERAWVAATTVHVLGDGVCHVLIDRLIEAPATAQRSSLHVRGRDVLPLQRRLGDRLGAFLHLHPPDADGQTLTPDPSPADFTVAWNLEAATLRPAVFPIALFGNGRAPGRRLAVHAFQAGRLAPIDLEVIP